MFLYVMKNDYIFNLRIIGKLLQYPMVATDTCTRNITRLFIGMCKLNRVSTTVFTSDSIVAGTISMFG